MRLHEGSLTWDDRDGISAASLLAKFHMSYIDYYSGVGCLEIHLRLYSTIMRAHGIDDAWLLFSLCHLMEYHKSGSHQLSLQDSVPKRM